MNRYYGLFQVHDRIFQVRGYDVTNLTLIAGDTGWIIIDPMSNAEAMRAALELIEKDIEERPIAAVIYTAASVTAVWALCWRMPPQPSPLSLRGALGMPQARKTCSLKTAPAGSRSIYMAACFRPALRAACSSAKMKPLQMVQPPT